VSIGDRRASDQSVTGREWVGQLAATLGLEPPDDATIDTLLDLAGVAAHASERIAAPIACYLVGLAQADPATVLDAARAREAERTATDQDG
jgi:hypothetical protein